MAPEAYLSLMVGFLSLLGLMGIGLARILKVEARVDLIWHFLARRGVADAFSGGLLLKESPLRLNIAALERHPELLKTIKEFYANDKRTLGDIELVQDIEAKFGTTLMPLAIKEGVTVGGCLMAMAFLIRPDMDIFKKYDTQKWNGH
jgi:hypothetical protein